MEIFSFMLQHPNKSLSILLVIVGIIDYIAGSTPTKKDDKYIGFTRRILHYLRSKFMGGQ